MKRYAVFLFLGLCLVGLISGCHTVRGAGQDVSSAGNGIQRATE